MSTTVNPLNFCEIICSYYTNLTGVKVVIGDSPRVNLLTNTIEIPEFNFLDKKQLLLNKHYLLHEIGHVLYSERSYLKGLKFFILNILEDFRINSILEEKYQDLNFKKLNAESLPLEGFKDLDNINIFKYNLILHLDGSDLIPFKCPEWEIAFNNSIQILDTNYIKRSSSTKGLEDIALKIYSTIFKLLPKLKDDYFSLDSNSNLQKKLDTVDNVSLEDLAESKFFNPLNLKKISEDNKLKKINIKDVPQKSKNDFYKFLNYREVELYPNTEIESYFSLELDRQIKNILNNFKQLNWEHFQAGGRLLLPHLKSYTNKIFSCPTLENDFNEEDLYVAVLLDLSGSMAPYKKELDFLSKSFSTCLNNNRIDNSILGFFTEDSQICISNIAKGLCGLDPQGSTPLVESLKYLLSHYVFVKSCKKKLVFIITDGCPNNLQDFKDTYTSLLDYSDILISFIFLGDSDEIRKFDFVENQISIVLNKNFSFKVLESIFNKINLFVLN